MDIVSTMDKVLSTLDGINSDDSRKVMIDYDSFINKIHHRISVQTFIDHYRDAGKRYLKGNSAGERKSLIFARNIFESSNIKIEDLKNERVRDYRTGNLFTSDIMVKRLHELRIDLWK